MAAINNNPIPEKGDGAVDLLKYLKDEHISVPIRVVGTVRAKRSLFVFVSIAIVLLLCTVTLAVGFWLKSERKLPQFCCPCDKLKETPGTVRKTKLICCINTESEYVKTMKHMLNTSEPKELEDPKANIAEKEMKMLVAKNENITLLHSSPVAAHVLVACTNSSFYPYPQEVQDLPSTRTLELLPQQSLSLLRGVELRKDHLIIQIRGLYLIYSQIYFKVIRMANWPLNLLRHIVERYNRRIPNDGIEILLHSYLTLPYPLNTNLDFHSSFITGVVELEVNDEVYVRASSELDISRHDTSNYLGVVKLDG